MKNIVNYIPSILVAGLIAYLSLLREPDFRMPDNVAFIDKWAHIVMYMVFAGVLTRDLWHSRANTALTVCCALSVPVLYGSLMEILQEQFFYPRTGEWLDWLADIVGTVIGFAIVLPVLRKVSKH